MVLEIIDIKLSCILKIMSRNTFPEPQPDSASYPEAIDWNITLRTQISFWASISEFGPQ